MNCQELLTYLLRQVGDEEGGEARVLQANKVALDRFIESYNTSVEQKIRASISISPSERDKLLLASQRELDEALRVELPSPLQERPFYLVVRGIADLVERAIEDIGALLPVKPVVGSLPVGTVNAATFPCTCAGNQPTYLLVFSSGLLTFLHLMAGVVLAGVREQLFNLRILRQEISSKGARQPREYILTLPEDIVSRYSELIYAFVFEGDLNAISPHVADRELYEEYSFVRSVMESFAVAHEYSHIALRHFDPKEVRSEEPLADIPDSFMQEYEADELARRLCQVLWGAGYGYFGADLLLTCINTLEDVLSLAGQTYPGPRYPPAKVRRDYLRSHIKESALYAGKIADQRLRISDLEERCLDFQAIAELLHELTRERFRGRSVASIWQSKTWHMATRWQRR